MFTAGIQRHRTFGALPSVSTVPNPTQQAHPVNARPQTQQQTTRNIPAGHLQPVQGPIISVDSELKSQPKQSVNHQNHTLPKTLPKVSAMGSGSSKRTATAAHPGIANPAIEKNNRAGRYGGRTVLRG